MKFVISIFMFLMSTSSFAANYYVSAAGNDNNAGTSTGAPWKTLNKLNQRNFAAGDQVLFRGGDTFSGTLSLNALDTGSAASPLVIKSYGTGKAKISAGSGNGIYAYNTAGIKIENLTIAGSGAGTNSGNGIYFYNDLSGNIKLNFISINDVVLSGFGVAGISIGAWNGSSGFSNVTITNVTTHSNKKHGILVWGYDASGFTGYSHQNLYIGYSKAYSNLGVSGDTNPTGSGIAISSVDVGTIERCLAYSNGANNTASTGPVGIWAWRANQIKIQYNESYNNRTTVGAGDGGGFDLDGGVTNSIMQYNYSHGNDGAGYLVYGYVNSLPNSGNTVRYNISENDGRKNGYAAIQVGASSIASAVQNVAVYNNTIFMAPATQGTPWALKVAAEVDGAKFYNNIFQTTGGVPLVWIDSSALNVQLVGNNYWSSGSYFGLWRGSQEFTSLGAFRAGTGQEIWAGVDRGLQVNPGLVNPGSGVTIGNPSNMSSLTNYKLMSSSALINSGLNINSLFGISPGQVDYFGVSIPISSFDIGASEYN